MQKVLVTGAGGAIGVHVIKYLLSEGKYEITGLDLNNSQTVNRLKKFRRRINIVYGDICDKLLIEALVKDHDIVIHLASSLPPLACLSKKISKLDYEGTENIRKAISYYNPNCHLFFASTMSLYKNSVNVTTKTNIKLTPEDYFTNAKYDAENKIKAKLNNYTIYRLPLVLSNLNDEPFMYHVKNDSLISVITKEDAAYAFVRGIKYLTKLNKKTFNVTSGEEIRYKDLLNKILVIHGLSFKWLLARIFLPKNYYSPVAYDKDELNNIINYRNDTLNDYYNRLRNRSKKRKIPRFLAKLFIKRGNNK